MNKKQIARQKSLLPGGVPKYIRCYESREDFVDRFTVVFTGHYTHQTGGAFWYLGMNDSPFHPQGFGQHGESMYTPIDRPTYGHLGRKIKWADLPPDCQKLVLDTYLDLWDLKEKDFCVGVDLADVEKNDFEKLSTYYDADYNSHEWVKITAFTEEEAFKKYPSALAKWQKEQNAAIPLTEQDKDWYQEINVMKRTTLDKELDNLSILIAENLNLITKELDKQICHYLLGWLIQKEFDRFYFDPIFTDNTKNAIDRIHHLDNDLFIPNDDGIYLIGFEMEYRSKEKFLFSVYDTALGMQYFLDYNQVGLDGKKAFFKKLSPPFSPSK